MTERFQWMLSTAWATLSVTPLDDFPLVAVACTCVRQATFREPCKPRQARQKHNRSIAVSQPFIFFNKMLDTCDPRLVTFSRRRPWRRPSPRTCPCPCRPHPGDRPGKEEVDTRQNQKSRRGLPGRAHGEFEHTATRLWGYDYLPCRTWMPSVVIESMCKRAAHRVCPFPFLLAGKGGGSLRIATSIL
jgi:hypothetical protein